MRHKMSRFLKPLLSTMACVTLAGACAARSAPPTADQRVQPADVAITGALPDARAILAARDSLNRALRDRDTGPFAHFWLEDVQMTFGSGTFYDGRDSSVQVFSRFFIDSTFVSGVRTAERVDVGVASNERGQAAEAGRWVWRTRSAEGVREAQGRYLVFWRQTAEGWRIRSELYVTTACVSGPGCGRTR
jgi:ketosteroid isomerase-like protein